MVLVLVVVGEYVREVECLKWRCTDNIGIIVGTCPSVRGCQWVVVAVVGGLRRVGVEIVVAAVLV